LEEISEGLVWWISIASNAATESAQFVRDDAFKAIVLFCCAGLLASLCVTTFGVDLGAVWV
jgi:uncharacterized membrane protein